MQAASRRWCRARRRRHGVGIVLAGGRDFGSGFAGAWEGSIERVQSERLILVYHNIVL